VTAEQPALRRKGGSVAVILTKGQALSVELRGGKHAPEKERNEEARETPACP